MPFGRLSNIQVILNKRDRSTEILHTKHFKWEMVLVAGIHDLFLKVNYQSRKLNFFHSLDIS